jgi:aspartate/methionine/tyrosine aminotransferase
VVVTAGGNMAFVDALLAIADVGDEVILPSPYYFNHAMAVTMAGARVVTVPTLGDFQLDPESIRRAITPRTRAVVTVSPNNPTGAVFREDALREVNEICARAGVYHVSDEAYEYFTYGEARHFSPASIPGSERHTISLFSLSKAYGFASWRIGYMVIPERLAGAVSKIQDTLVICPPVVSQVAALGALEAGVEYCRGQLRSIAGTREAVLRELDRLGEGCTVAPAEGALYFILRVRTDLSDVALAERLVREHRVAVIPGSTFGMGAGCSLRLSYGALDADSVAEGIGRLARGLESLVGRAAAPG